METAENGCIEADPLKTSPTRRRRIQGSMDLDQILGRGRNSSVGSAWARCPQRRGFDPPLETFSVEGIFPFELTWVQTPFPPKTPSDESINRGLVCAYMHFIARTQKILTFMS